jgi:hypothetical protein
MSKKIETELAELQHELHERIRTDAARMSAEQRSEYARSLPPNQRKLYREILQDEAPRGVRPNPVFAVLDQAWGLTASPGRAVSRSATQLTADPLAASKPHTYPQPSAARAARAPGGMYPRASARVGRVTALSPHAAELDARMGIAPSAPRVVRTRNSLTFSAF